MTLPTLPPVVLGMLPNSTVLPPHYPIQLADRSSISMVNPENPPQYLSATPASYSSFVQQDRLQPSAFYASQQWSSPVSDNALP
ncbi:unnamed protein product [Thelazia callipaeda]|uniref:Ovule protein n=1 Tax=Thelazia callipaeda TaxID=103827 RepID=A0A0N5DBH1_THECL|nr:unnamed protein product [Thelazia callipaeda]